MHHIVTREQKYHEGSEEKSMTLFGIVDGDGNKWEGEEGYIEEAEAILNHFNSLNPHIFRKKASLRPYAEKPFFHIELKRTYVSKLLHWLENVKGVEIYKPRQRRFFYNFRINGVEFRVLPTLNIIEMGDDDFDRWANSSHTSLPIPTNQKEFIYTMMRFNQIRDEEFNAPFLHFKRQSL